ncbi:MAGE protein [Coccomyxa subellipsoidea C-169]|uniref:MAGE protein n=1 Tax=Coccomyxa subellipsoidea (strain C-169) TaxID=574566 RepID=I0YMR7_COCSC|nr:MAGE protein [Coccomyxa subellipsoidea C-169]EIE19686.1 MAGE protein [Coccomyxa subellipsoidea C-169]|eukprot:XP_005644230.1 MAGE protein [Coccomyxa subellipsoidea C-169]
MILQRDFYKAEAENVDNPQLSREESDQLVAAVVRFMLFRQHQKSDQLVRRDELGKLIQNTHRDGGRRSGNVSAYVIAQAQAQFPVIFGLEMKMVEILPASRAGGKAKGEATPSKAYVLRSLLPEAMRTTFVTSASADATPAFVLLVLSLINLAGGAISEDDLWRHLENVGVEAKVPHPSLGQPEHQLELMLKKRYILEQKQPSNEGPLKSYVLGENSIDEIQANEIKEFVDERLEAMEADAD